jgi:hypothetical protein
MIKKSLGDLIIKYKRYFENVSDSAIKMNIDSSSYKNLKTYATDVTEEGAVLTKFPTIVKSFDNFIMEISPNLTEKLQISSSSRIDDTEVAYAKDKMGCTTEDELVTFFKQEIKIVAKKQKALHPIIKRKNNMIIPYDIALAHGALPVKDTLYADKRRVIYTVVYKQGDNFLSNPIVLFLLVYRHEFEHETDRYGKRWKKVTAAPTQAHLDEIKLDIDKWIELNRFMYNYSCFIHTNGLGDIIL